MLGHCCFLHSTKPFCETEETADRLAVDENRMAIRFDAQGPRSRFQPRDYRPTPA